jgi:hypothetical protein
MLSMIGPVQARCQDTGIRLTANAQQNGRPLVHFWSKVVGAGRANEGPRATWQEELQTAHDEAGFQYVRFHGIFHDDTFVYREDHDGKSVLTINTSTISSTGCWHMACDHLSNWDSFPLRLHS